MKLKENGIENFKRKRNRLIYDLSIINILKSRLPKRIWNKLTVDRCLQDCIRYDREGFTCTANTKKLTVWPDATVLCL